MNYYYTLTMKIASKPLPATHTIISFLVKCYNALSENLTFWAAVSKV